MITSKKKVFPAKTAGKTFHKSDFDITVTFYYTAHPLFKIKSVDISFGKGKITRTGNRKVNELFETIESWLNGDIDALPVENLDLGNLSSFQRKILCELRKKVLRGKTVSYGQLAELAGFPGAARAVGSVMSHNPFPLFFPCHRVIKGDGSIGFFQGGPTGVSLKKALLKLEGREL
jgi:methylated-DNA-[protein]-cysteine S-methyltransferase